MKTLFTALTLMLLSTSAYSQYDLITAHELYDEAKAHCEKINRCEANLFYLQTFKDPILPDSLNLNEMGTASTWYYGFYLPEADLFSLVVGFRITDSVDIVDEFYYEYNWSRNNDTTTTLYGWADSPATVDAILENGAKDYLESHADAVMDWLYLSRMPGEHDSGKWALFCKTPTDTLCCLVLAATLESVECQMLTDVEVIPTAESLSMDTPYPNPVQAGSFATVSYTLERSMRIRASANDVAGREVGVVFEGEQEAGTHSLVIPQSVLGKTGIYFIRLDTDRASVSQKIVVVR
ncbi:MAG: T9SS type A sorting domain-containing protein [Bacteroidota bacterium]|jgi:hypothetical protein